MTKDKVNLSLLMTALHQRNRSRDETLATIFLDLPDSNGAIHLCIRKNKYGQLTALLLPAYAPWCYADPPTPRGEMVLPCAIHAYIKRKLREFNILHIIGIIPKRKVPKGVLLTEIFPEVVENNVGSIH